MIQKTKTWKKIQRKTSDIDQSNEIDEELTYEEKLNQYFEEVEVKYWY